MYAARAVSASRASTGDTPPVRGRQASRATMGASELISSMSALRRAGDRSEGSDTRHVTEGAPRIFAHRAAVSIT